MPPHLFLLLLLIGTAACSTISVTIDHNGNCVFGNDTGSHAQGTLSDAAVDGWFIFQVTANPSYPDIDMARASGCVEGYLSADLTIQLFENISPMWFPNGTWDPKIREFVMRQEEWVMDQVYKHPDDPYWQHINLIMVQRDGMLAGFQAVKGTLIDADLLLAMSAMPDLMDLRFVNNSAGYEMDDIDTSVLNRYATPHCSAAVRLLDNDIILGHSTWFIYSAMTKMIKTYNLPYQIASTHTIRTSAYPMSLSSNDDFYVASSGLIVTETTFGVYNQSLYDRVTPQCVLSWLRGLVATRMAQDALDWSSIYSQHISGTQNNMWIVLDSNKYTPNKPLEPNTLYIVEQAPCYTQGQDVTDILVKQGYFGSYNVPLSREIWYDLGYGEQEQQHGPDMFDYSKCVRAAILSRECPLVNDMTGFKKVIRYNNYVSDPLSKHNPEYAIDSRQDLSGVGPFGAVDAKAISVKEKGSFWAQYGPTHDDLTPFKWEDYPKWSHKDLPEEYEFEWSKM